MAHAETKHDPRTTKLEGGASTSFGKVGSLEFEKAPLNSGGRVRIREDPARIRGRLNSARAVRIHPALRIRRRGLNSEGARIRGHPPNSGHGPNSDGPSRIRRTTNSGTPPEFRPPPSEFGPPAPPNSAITPEFSEAHGTPSNSGGGKPDSKGVEFRRSSRIQTPPEFGGGIPNSGDPKFPNV